MWSFFLGFFVSENHVVTRVWGKKFFFFLLVARNVVCRLKIAAEFTFLTLEIKKFFDNFVEWAGHPFFLISAFLLGEAILTSKEIFCSKRMCRRCFQLIELIVVNGLILRIFKRCKQAKDIRNNKKREKKKLKFIDNQNLNETINSN